MKRSCCFIIVFAFLSGIVLNLHAQAEGHDVRAKRESDRGKEERAKDDRRTTDMKTAEKKADSSFWGQQGSQPKSAQDLKRARESRSSAQMSADLRSKIDRNSVQFTTATTKGHIDLVGDSHFDKKTQRDIPTPHVQTQEKSVGPNGKVNYGKETVKPATKQDIRTAQKIVDRKK